MIRKLAALALSAAILPSAANAVVYDAFSSFNATQGAGNFYYGQSPNTNTGLTQFTATTNCFIDGSICLDSAANHDVPGVTKSTSTSFQYGTVNVPDDRLLLHPSSDSSQNVDVVFLNPTAGQYRVDATFSVQDINPTGVNVSLLTDLGDLLPYSLTSLGTLSSGNTMFTYSGIFNLAQNDVVGFAFNNDGDYRDDSTGLKFTVSAVPEPVTWAMMIGGFGLVGGMMRRAHRNSEEKFTRKVRSLATA